LTRSPGAGAYDSLVVGKVFGTFCYLNNLSVALFAIIDFAAKVIVELAVDDFMHIGILSISHSIYFKPKIKF